MTGLPRIENEEQQAMRMLAEYDAQLVDERSILRIFNATPAQLVEVRKQPYYRECLQNETDRLEQQATSIDESWNRLEETALGNLNEQVELLTNPRELVAIARTANQANRRRRPVGNHQTSQAIIDVDKLTSGGSKVVRLRTKFAQRLMKPNGDEEITLRQTEIREEYAGDLQETFTPQTMKQIMRDELGIETDELLELKQGYSYNGSMSEKMSQLSAKGDYDD